MATILVVDDDADVARVLGTFFERSGHQVIRVDSGEAAIEAFERTRPELVLLDLRLPDMEGFDVLKRIREHDPVVVMITGHGDIALAVEAMRIGAENFLTKPVDLDHLAVASERALEKARLRQMNSYLRERRGVSKMSTLLGSSPAMLELAHQIELLATSERTTVLLLGESGTGKGRVAAAIHELSPRVGRPFIEMHCAGLVGSQLDDELFGHEGAVTSDARERKLGLFEVADGGSIFLDEIGELDSQLQPKMLKVLESGSFRRMGGTQEITVDVRVIAATNADLVAEVNDGRFREDLYYRLSVMPVHLPPLRARAREDVLDLVSRTLDELHTQLPGAPAELTEAALDHLLRYPWPGNVRELRNVLERAMIVGRGARRLGAEHLPAEVRRASGSGLARHTPKSLAEIERAHIERTLRAHNANRTRAARELGISRATLINKIKAYGIGSIKSRGSP
ncbi:MAG TPA: sigma-54 dependent transcriptional regulator [Gemmatimonadaceae bacterium]|nr:sigma-54 dependent transcriptional regulator [Gemmatimonadaceae bacterium]